MKANLAVPHFARLADYAGPWLIEPTAARDLVRFALSIDLAAHVRSGVAQPKAAAPPLETVAGKGGKSVAVVSVIGPMMKSASSLGGTSTVAARKAIRQAAADSTVSGILLRIDSPGGTVAGTADLAADVRAARGSKPVWAQIEDTGASAAYWVASQASQVWANAETAMVGSIGTMIRVLESAGTPDANGLREVVFATGPYKAIGAKPMTEDEAGVVQALADALQVPFDAAVKKGRRLTDAQLAAVRTGQVWTAPEALRRKLIDGIRSTDETLKALASIN